MIQRLNRQFRKLAQLISFENPPVANLILPLATLKAQANLAHLSIIRNLPINNTIRLLIITLGNQSRILNSNRSFLNLLAKPFARQAISFKQLTIFNNLMAIGLAKAVLAEHGIMQP